MNTDGHGFKGLTRISRIDANSNALKACERVAELGEVKSGQP
jgi:hypothetical protein